MFHHLLIPIADSAAAPSFNPSSLIWMGCIFVIFYFMAIRPQSQKAKQQQALIEAVKTGDRIITASGMHGLVSNVKDTTILLKVADNVKIEIEKTAIGTVIKREDEPSAAAPAA